MLHTCPACDRSFACWRLWTVKEIAEFFKVGQRTIIRWQDEGELRYRLQLTRRGRTRYKRVSDSIQFENFIRAKLPQPHELDPDISDTHRQLIHYVLRARRNGRAGVAAKNLDPTLSPLSSTLNHVLSQSDRDNSEKDGARINQDERSPTGPYQSEGENKETERVEGERERETEQGKE